MKDEVKQSLANIPLRWMIMETMKSKCGVQFDTDELNKLGIPSKVDELPSDVEKPHRNAVRVEGSDDLYMLAADKEDSDKAMKDALKTNKFWWILEVLPLSFPQSKHSRIKKSVKLNLGRGRHVYTESERPLFHISVKDRMHKLGYKPNAKYTPGTEKYTL